MVTTKITQDKELNALMLSLLTDVFDLPDCPISSAPNHAVMTHWIARVRTDAPALRPKLSEEIKEAVDAAYAYQWAEHYDYDDDDLHASNVMYSQLLGELADVANCLLALVFAGASDDEFAEFRAELGVLRNALKPIRLPENTVLAIVTRAYAKGFEVATRPHGGE